VCIGLNYMANTPYAGLDKPRFGDYLVVVSIRGLDTDRLNLTATGHGRIDDKDILFDVPDPQEKVTFFKKDTFKSFKFRIS